MVYIYWDNPFYGYTHFRFKTARDDVYPDCDFDPPAGASGFSDTGTLDFTLKMTAYELGDAAGTTITNVSDLVLYTESVLAPVSFLGQLGISDHLEVDDAVNAAPVSFGTASLPPVSLKLLTEAAEQQWVGQCDVRWLLAQVITVRVG